MKNNKNTTLSEHFQNCKIVEAKSIHLIYLKKRNIEGAIKNGNDFVLLTRILV